MSSQHSLSFAPEANEAISLSRSAILDRLPALAEAIGVDAARRERERELPFEAFAWIRQAGLGGLRVPASLGGPDGSVAELLEGVTQLAAADSNVAHALRSHFNFVETILLASEEERHRFVGPILDGTIFGGAHTELGTARPGEIQTRLTRQDGGHRLNGRKHYATGAIFADRLFISAVSEDGRPVGVEIGPRDPGVTVLDDWDGMGQRLTASGGILLENVEISEDKIEWRDATERQDFAGRHAATFRQLYLAACVAGILRNVLSDAVGFVREKARPITHSPAETAREDPFVQRVVGQIAARSFAVDALVGAAAGHIDRAHVALFQGEGDADRLLTESAIATAKAQSAIADIALAAASAIFDTGGGSGTAKALNFDRHWRNIRTILSHNPTDHKLKAIGVYELTGEGPPLGGGFF